MANRSSRQHSAASPASQNRRSSRSSRKSIVGTPSRRASARRTSNRDTVNIPDDFDWGPVVDSDGNELTLNDLLDGDFGFDISDFLPEQNDQPGPVNENSHAAVPVGRPSSNLYENPGVAVPGTPYATTFAQGAQQTDPPMGHQPGIPPITPVLVDGKLVVPFEQIAAMMPAIQSQTMLMDGKRTSVPKSPTFAPRKRQASQLHVQVPDQTGLVRDKWMGQGYYDNSAVINPAALNGNLDGDSLFIPPGNHPTYQDPEHVHHTQPYYQGSYQQGAPSPASKRARSHPPEPEEVVLDPPQKRSLRSTSTYSSHNNSSGSSRQNSSTLRKKHRTAKSRVAADKRVSVYDHEAAHKYQKPQLNPRNPDVRINKTTKGLTTRTGKINDYNPCLYYTYEDHPIGNWRSDRFEHKYRDSSLVDETTGDRVAIFEMEERHMSAAKIRDFILNYPYDRNTLTLRIQVAPGDSGGRYNLAGSKCRFAECPGHRAGLNGTIKHGWYRVAFDERDEGYDPFAACCGFAHLYCMERFLDFEYICRKANVVVETRAAMETEPGGKYAASLALSHQSSAYIAEQFILAARGKRENGKKVHRQRGDHLGVRQLPEFQNYPVHEDYPDGAEKPYHYTLSYEMMRRKEEKRQFAQKNQFATSGKKGLGPSKLTVHRGDLDMVAEDHIREKAYKKALKKAKGKGKKMPQEDTYDSDSPFSIKVRREIARAERDLEQLAATTTNPRAHVIKKRQLGNIHEEPDIGYAATGSRRQPWEVSDDESDAEDFTYHSPGVTPGGTRRSNRLKNAGQQPNYRDEPEDGYQQQPGNQTEYDHLGLDFRASRSGSSSRQHYQGQIGYGGNPQLDQQRKRKRSYQGSAQVGYDDIPQAGPPTKRMRAAQGYGGQQQYYEQPYDPRPMYGNQQYAYGQPEYHNTGNFEGAYTQQRKRAPSVPDGFQHARPYEDAPPYEGELPPWQLFPPMESAYHRMSASGVVRAPSGSNSIMRQPGARTPSLTKRHASFNTQPVSSQKTFKSNAPPQNVQSRMVKELENDSSSKNKRSSKKSDSDGVKLRSGRLVSLSD